MNKKTVLIFLAGVAAGVVFAPKLTTLPLVRSLPQV